MQINKIKNGVVIDHIKAGTGFKMYNLLGLDKFPGMVALLKNVDSEKMGRKDILKIETEEDLNLNLLAFLDKDCTVNIIKKSKLIEKKNLELPQELINIVHCKNPRCIKTIEQELPDHFILTDKSTGTYRCIYCETKYENK